MRIEKAYWPKEIEAVLVKILKYDDNLLNALQFDKRILAAFNLSVSPHVMLITELNDETCTAQFCGHKFIFNKKDSLCETEGYKLQIVRDQEVETNSV